MDDASILVVEDEALIRIATMQIVEDAGYSVVEAADADEALIMLERCPGINTVVTDINMPGTIDGLQLSRVIRIRWPQICLIVTSGRFAVSALQMPPGAYFIAKPYTPQEVVAALRDCAA